MSAVNQPTNRRLSAWEMRERMKASSKAESVFSIAAKGIPSSSESSRRRRTISSNEETKSESPSKNVPPAFRLIARHQSSEDKSMRTGKRVVANRVNGMSTASKVRENSRERKHRKSNIKDSFQKYALDSSMSKSKNGGVGTRSVDQPKEADQTDIGDNSTTAPMSEPDHDSMDDDKSIDLSAINDVVKTVRKLHDSQNAKFLAERGNESYGELNRSLDLSSHRLRNKTGDISTSASDDQWARFKLLGRIGLGEIKPGEAAQAFIKQNVKILHGIIKQVMALREGDDETNLTNNMHRSMDFRTGQLLEEVKETVEIKKTRARFKRDPNKIKLDRKPMEQLEDYVAVIAQLYRDNPFHNFEHASTVLSAVNKVVSLAVAPDDIDYTDIRFITTDPWTHFALAYSALIHDVDHAGVPNAQLIKEKSHVAAAYKNKSVAEQNSLELSWNLLMEPCYRELRDALFVNASELLHFRSMVVTATLATDIADKELAAMRRDRAAEALAVLDDEPTSDAVASGKATFVLETLIQVADVSHLMMPFQFYKKWNFRLLRETHQAFLNGRAEKDPLDSWYNGEFGFFDFYIIPLAKKLDKIGIDSTPYLDNATNNRKQWEEIGEELVEGFKRQLRMGKATSTPSPSAPDVDDSTISLDSSCESSFTSDFDGFGADFSDDRKDSHSSTPLRTPQQTQTPQSAKARIQAIHKEKTDEYAEKFQLRGRVRTPSPGRKGIIVTAAKSERGERSIQKRPVIPGGSERGERSIQKRSVIPGGSERGERTVRRIVYKSKAAPPPESPKTPKYVDVEPKKMRSRTPIPPGERRFFQKSKSCASDLQDVPACSNGSISDGDDKSTRSSSRKKNKPMRRKLRSKSLDSSRTDNNPSTQRGRRP